MQPLRLLLVSLVFVSLPAVAGAQGQSHDKLIAQGLEEFELGNWVEARSLLQKVHGQSPSARTARALAMIAFELRHYVRCVSLLTDALADPNSNLTDEMREAAEALQVRAKSYVGRLDVQVVPAGAQVIVDGAPITRDSAGLVPLNAGEHTLVAQAPGYLRETRTLDVQGGSKSQLQLTLVPTPAGTAATASAAPAAQPAAPTPTASADGDDNGASLVESPWFWVTVGAALAAGTITAVALNADDEVRPTEAGDVGGVIMALGAKR